MSMGKPHAHVRESMESISASSLSLLRQILDQVLPFASSPIHVFNVVPVVSSLRYLISTVFQDSIMI